jgi:hypothetical protein
MGTAISGLIHESTENPMNAFKVHRILAPLILGLTTASLAMAGDTTDRSASKPDVAYSSATLVLSLRGPGGEASRLVRVPGVGWTHTGKVSSGSDGDGALRRTSSVSTPTQAPLSVFIDGPTGYTFLFTQDSGWKFVGVIDSADDGSLQSSSAVATPSAQ